VNKKKESKSQASHKNWLQSKRNILI
jgi:hypothetical protein